MSRDAERNVRQFYEEVGWTKTGDVHEDARLFEDLREVASEYVSRCRRRVLEHIPPRGERLLDMGSGAIQFPEYLEYSTNFDRRYCVDLSARALRQAEEKIGGHGVFLEGNFLEMEFEDDFFDCSISLHAIYHIDESRQEEAVRKLLRVTKPGQPVIIVYSNPSPLVRRLSRPLRWAARPFRKRGEEAGLYFHPHPLDWWKRFTDRADVTVLPWRSFSSRHQKLLIPSNAIGRKMFEILYSCEERWPRFFARHFQYPLIVLRKLGARAV